MKVVKFPSDTQMRANLRNLTSSQDLPWNREERDNGTRYG